MSFQRGDACNLPSDLGQFGCVLASNLLCRLPNPYKFLDRLPSLVAPEGILVITGPYTWMEKFTPKVHAHAINLQAVCIWHLCTNLLKGPSQPLPNVFVYIRGQD